MKELFTALLAARAEFPKITKDRVNPYYKSKYADLASLIDATEPALAKYGLIIIQEPGEFVDGKISVTTALCHTSGQVREQTQEMPVSKADAQGVGSAITYARRYAYQAILNISAEEDDDGNAAVSPEAATLVEPPRSKSTGKPVAPPVVEVIPPKVEGVQVSFNPPFPDPTQKEKVDPAYCPHNRIQKAGISKKGKPYNSFCRDCGVEV